MMADQLIDSEAQLPRVSFWQHVVSFVLVSGFIAGGWLRLNDCDLFNPDSPRYLIYAQSLADTGQYRAIDTPGAPLYTWRPPGLPILLAPVLKFLPYDVVAAKCVVLLSAALLLLAVHAIASSTCGGWGGPLMVIVVGTSPLFLSLATEVLTEVPYALGILAVMYWLGRWDRALTSSRGIAYCGALIAMSFTPIVRTVGVAMIAAVGIWSLAARRRWKFLPAVAVAVGCLGWLAWRSRQAPGNNYAGSLLQSIREHGLPTVIGDALRTISFYVSAFPGVLLPGLTNEQPFYAPMAIGRLPALSELGPLVTVLASAVTLVGIVGLLRERAHAGLAGLLYLALYCACLAIWPWRHERFLWPLVPLLWAFVPAGFKSICQALPQRVGMISQPILVVGLIGFCAWQSLASAALVAANREFLANREQFYTQQAPGFYFSDWRGAGGWIHDNTPPHSRLLTWQAAVGGTAHRYQRRVQFETLSPDKLHLQITSFPARYIVVTTAQFGLGFGWQQVFADPSFSLQIVYQNRDVAVLEVGPNRSGTVSRTGYAKWLQAQQTALDLVLTQSPDRLDLMVRKADLLQEVGHNRQAIAILEDLVQRGMITVRVCSALGWLYFAERHYQSAARYLDLASGLPNAEPVAESLSDGARRARAKIDVTADESTENRIEAAISRIKNQVAVRNFSAAEREVDGVLAIAPAHAELNYWRGYLHHIFSEHDRAKASYLIAEQSGSKEASDKLLLFRFEEAITGPALSAVNVEGHSDRIDPGSMANHVRLAKLYDEQGWSGRALSTLETARQRFGDKPEILSPLAELYFRFARPENAVPLFKLAMEAWPHEKSLHQGLSAAEAALRVPKF